MSRLTPHRGRGDGQTLAELGVILGLIAIVLIAALLVLGGQISDVLDAASTPV